MWQYRGLIRQVSQPPHYFRSLCSDMQEKGSSAVTVTVQLLAAAGLTVIDLRSQVVGPSTHLVQNRSCSRFLNLFPKKKNKLL